MELPGVKKLRVYQVTADSAIPSKDDLLRGIEDMPEDEQQRRRDDHEKVIQALEDGKKLYWIRFVLAPESTHVDLDKMTIPQRLNVVRDMQTQLSQKKEKFIHNFSKQTGSLPLGYSSSSGVIYQNGVTERRLYHHQSGGFELRQSVCMYFYGENEG